MAEAAPAKTPYYKVFCEICGKSHPNRAQCPLVASRRPVDTSKRSGSGLTPANAIQDKAQRDADKMDRDVQRMLQKEERGRGKPWTKVARASRQPSDACSVVSDSAASIPGSVASECWSVSTAATLNPSEEMEARKLEVRVRKLNSLESRKTEGKYPLSNAEEMELKAGKLEINYSPVWVKLQTGIGRCTLDTDPLTRDEEKQVRSAEERLRAIKLLEDRKASGEWLQGWEMAEMKSRGAIESSPLMMRVRKGAPRCALDRPAPAPAPAPKALWASAPVTVSVTPVQQASPAAPAAPARAAHDDAAEAATKVQEPKLKDMVAIIREHLDIEDSFTTPGQVIAEANRQLDLQATGTVLQQARVLLSQITD